MDSQDPSTQPERKGIKLSRLIVMLVCLAAVAAAGIAIRTRVLTKKVTVQQPNVSRTVQPAPSKDAARAQSDRTPTDKQKQNVVVDLRGKGRIKREEVFTREETVAGIEPTRMSREGEGESERERERKKQRYAYIGRVARMAGQSGSDTPPIRDSRPTEHRLNRSGRSFNGDLRNLPKTKPIPRERPEREDPPFNPIEIRREGQQPTQSIEKPTKPLSITAAAPPAILGFEGLDRQNWGAGSPPDTNGDVGPSYYIQTVNTSVGIYDKTNGNQVAAFTFDTLMSQGNFGNQCDNHNFGDPVVLYDTFEDRWILTDFAFTLDGGGNVNPPIAFQCFAVSKTGNPVTGGWNFYSSTLTDFLGDYPKFGVWTDGIYMSANLFGFPASSANVGVRTWAFNKAQMYAGAPTVQSVSFNLSGDFTVLPSNARLQVGTPPPGRPNLFLSTNNFLNALTIYKFHVDWNRISLSTFTGPDTPLAATSWPNAAVANVPQPGTTNLLDSLAIRAMVQNQYTNYGGTESLWASHTVRRANTTGFAAPRWYQVNVTGGTVAANLPQAATWDPDGANVLHRWMPSLALDRAGNLAMGYSTSSSTVFPSFAYAGRLAADPINTFSQTEQTLFTGTASQTGTVTRWGDYSSMTLDPNGCTLWYTTEYSNPALPQTASNRWKTRVNSFSYASIGQCTPFGAGGTVAGTVTATSGGAPISGATVALGARTTTTDGSGLYQFTSIPAGTYPSITASAAGYNSQTFTSILVNDGATTTQNFSLGTAPVAACLTDTTQADFQTGVPTNVDLTASPGDVVLAQPIPIDQQNTAGTTTGTGFGTPAWTGQTFIAGVTGQLVKADIQLFCSGCGATPPNLTLSVRATTGAAPGGLPTGADLASTTIPGSTFASGAITLYTASFGSPATLTSGTQYALILRPVSAPAGSGYFWVRSSPTTYASGSRVLSADSGGTWSADTTRDYNFKTYMSTGYAASGNLVSGTKDANPAVGTTPHWTTLSWTASTPANTALSFQAAASNSATGPFNFVGPDGTAATFFTTTGASLSQFDGMRYLQYKAYLSTTNGAVTPTLNDVTVCYDNITGTLGGGGTICAGGSTNVTVTVSGGTPPYTVILSNGGGTQTGNGPVFTFPVSPGVGTTIYTLAAGSVDANNVPIIGSGSAMVTVNPIPATPTITPSGPTTFCAGGSVTLTSSSESGNQWYLNGNPIGGATNQTYIATASGNYTVVVTLLSCASAPSAPTTVTVNPVPPMPTVTPGGPTTFCTGGSVTLTSSSATGNQWYLNGNPIGGATNQTYVATASGNYTVIVTASGCSSLPSAPTTVTVNPIPPTPTITPGGPTTFCAGGSVTLTSSSATGNQWYLNGNPIGGATNQTYIATASGNYTVIVTTSGCSSAPSLATTVTVNPIPPTPTVTPGGPTTFCTGGSVTLTSSSATGNQWYLNGNPIGGATNQTYIATASGNYTVIVTASGCSSLPSAPTTVTVNPIPPTPTITPGGPTTFCGNGSVTLTSSSATGNQWYLNGNPIGGATNQTYVATAQGNYTVIVTTNGCSSAASAPVTVTINPTPPTPTITPSGTATLCLGSNVTLTSSSASGNQWYLNGSPISGATSQTYIATLQGSYTVTATANGCTSIPSAPTTLTVTTITVNPNTLPGGTLGVGYSQTVSATPAGAYNFTVTSGTLPTGLTLNATTGVISGTPSATGSFNFRVTAALNGCSGFRDYTVAITCPAVSLSPAALPAGTAGASYNQTITASPAGSYTFSLITGTLPSGLVINSTTGVISGLPTVAGTYNFTVKAAAANGCSGTQSYSLQINCPAAITLSPASLPNGSVGTAYSQTISATPAGGNYSYSLSGTLPPGLNLNSGTGVLSGTPTTNGTYNFTVVATGFGSCTSAPKSYSITIGSGACSVTLPASLPGGSVGQLYNQSVAASPAGSYTYLQTGSLPTGVTFYNAAALLFGYPTAPGSFTFTITATDSNNCSATQSYTVVIGSPSFAKVGDFDGDGKTDFTVWRGMQSNWMIVQSSNGQSQNVLWGAEYAPYNDVITPGDYDGDGKADIAVFRRGNGHWYIKRSSDGATVDKVWGLGTDVAVPGDYDGDGKTDIAVWRGSEGRWYIQRSSDGTVQTDVWGGGYAPYNDIPVPADYDGDGKTDIAVFRRGGAGAGHWYIKRSSDGVIVDKYWGLGTDVPVPADYDGDGKADIAVWRGTDTNWYITRSSNDTVQIVSWGSSSLGDKPTPGDYDGDGKADIAIWRESSGMWYVRCSGDGSVVTKANGQAGDRPIGSRPN